MNMSGGYGSNLEAHPLWTNWPWCDFVTCVAKKVHKAKQQLQTCNKNKKDSSVFPRPLNLINQTSNRSYVFVSAELEKMGVSIVLLCVTAAIAARCEGAMMWDEGRPVEKTDLELTASDSDSGNWTANLGDMEVRYKATWPVEYFSILFYSLTI